MSDFFDYRLRFEEELIKAHNAFRNKSPALYQAEVMRLIAEAYRLGFIDGTDYGHNDGYN